MRPLLTPNLRATAQVGSPTAKQSAISRCRSESWPSQVAKSRRIAASSAGVACRDSPNTSVNGRLPALLSRSTDITRNSNRRWAARDMTSLLLLRDPMGRQDRTRYAAYAPEPRNARVGPSGGRPSVQKERMPLRVRRRFALDEPQSPSAGRKNAGAFELLESWRQIGQCRARGLASRAARVDDGTWKRLSQCRDRPHPRERSVSEKHKPPPRPRESTLLIKEGGARAVGRKKYSRRRRTNRNQSAAPSERSKLADQHSRQPS